MLFEAFRGDPDANPLKTPSGKIELYSETIASFGYDDCPGASGVARSRRSGWARRRPRATRCTS